MKTTLKIARAELSNLFYSPIAWLVLVIFIFQSTLLFSGKLQAALITQDNMQTGLPLVGIFTKIIGAKGMLITIMSYLYLYIPLLTMGVISREISSGTLKLLLSSPIKIREIILGKYLAMVIYGILLLSMLVVCGLIATAYIPNFQIGVFFTAVLGVFLLVCTYIAIGMFLSSLTSYQVVAAFATLAVFALLNYIGEIGQEIAFVREITYYLSMKGRTINFLLGLLTTKDTFYYLIVIGLFLSLTWLRMHFMTRSVKPLIKVLGYTGVVAVMALSIFITTRPKLMGNYDATSNKQMTLSKNSLDIVSKFEHTPTMTIYVNLLDNQWFSYGSPRNRMKDQEYLRNYIRYMPDMEIEYKYYYHETPNIWEQMAPKTINMGTAKNQQMVKGTKFSTSNRANSKVTADNSQHEENNLALEETSETDKQMKALKAKLAAKRIEAYKLRMNAGPEMKARTVAEGHKIDFDDIIPYSEIKKDVDLSKSNFQLARVLEYKGMKAQLRMMGPQVLYPKEQNVSAALKTLLIGAPKILFTTGHYENSPYNFTQIGYTTRFRDLNFVLSMYNNGFDVDTLNLLKNEIPTDLAALVIADPKASFSPEELVKIHRYIEAGGNLLYAGNPGKQVIANSILSPTGAGILPGQLMQRNKYKTGAVIVHPVVNNPVSGEFANKVMMLGGAGVYYEGTKGFEVSPLLETDSNTTWLRTKESALDSIAPTYRPEIGDRTNKLAAAIAMTRNVQSKSQKILIVGDAEFLNNIADKNSNTGDVETTTFGEMATDWFGNGEFPIIVSPEKVQDTVLNMKDSQVTMIKTITNKLLPAGLGLLGIVLLLRRRKR